MDLSGTRAPVKRSIFRALIAAITVASRINGIFWHQCTYTGTNIEIVISKRILISVP